MQRLHSERKANFHSIENAYFEIQLAFQMDALAMFFYQYCLDETTFYVKPWLNSQKILTLYIDVSQAKSHPYASNKTRQIQCIYWIIKHIYHKASSEIGVLIRIISHILAQDGVIVSYVTVYTRFPFGVWNLKIAIWVCLQLQNMSANDA